MVDCIFCQIIKGDIPAHVVYRDDEFMAFLDIRPINRGHVLLIPLEHAEKLTDLPDNVLAAELPLARRIVSAVLEVTGATDFNLFNTNGVEAGQEVFHHHLHIIPRHAGDGLKFTLDPVSYGEGEAAGLADDIGQAMTS